MPTTVAMTGPELAARNRGGESDSALNSGLVLSGVGLGFGYTGGFAWGLALNLAVTALSAVTLIVQVLALGLSQPVQPAKLEPAAAVAVRTTEVPSL